jgi:hypothetical protein
MSRPTRKHIANVAAHLDAVGMTVAAQCVRNQEWHHLPSIIRTMREVTSLQNAAGKRVLAEVEALAKNVEDVATSRGRPPTACQCGAPRLSSPRAKHVPPCQRAKSRSGPTIPSAERIRRGQRRVTVRTT